MIRTSLLMALTVPLGFVPAQVGAAPGPEGQAASGLTLAPKDPANRYRFEAWYSDYPVELQLPQQFPQQVYERSRRQALEKVVANLQGNVSRESWQMAMEFFRRAPADAVQPLIEAMDRNFGKPSMQDFVKHCVEAMGQLGGEECDEALRRALEHPSEKVRYAVFTSLGGAGSLDTIRRTFPLFLSGMDGHARRGWLRAARLRLGDEAVGLFHQLMRLDTPQPIRDLVVVEALEMPPQQAASVFEDFWSLAVGDFKTVIAGVFHAAGRTSGTAHLATQLRSTNPTEVVHALNNLTHRGPLGLVDDVLLLSESPYPEVRQQVANLLSQEANESSTNALERLAAPDQPLEIRMIAMRALTERGRSAAVDYLLEEVETTTGSRLSIQLRLLGASGDPRCVPIFAERVRTSPPEEGREFLQALAFSSAKGAQDELVRLFLEPERPVAGKNRAGGQLTTWTYIPILLPNLRGQEQGMVEAWQRIPATDLQRRALYLQALLTVLADRTDPLVQEPILQLFREILFDAEAAPQLRIQALNGLTRKFLTLSDAMRLKRLQEPIGDRESPRMRALIKDFLFEYF
jgi:HEAT repeat protein